MVVMKKIISVRKLIVQNKITGKFNNLIYDKTPELVGI
jgi:hypothetical protein